MAKPKGGSAVMASKLTPAEDDLYGKLDFYPTPPWAARALMIVLAQLSVKWPMLDQTLWEPAAGQGHMAETLRPFFRQVYGSDVHDYGCGYDVGSFVGHGQDVAECPLAPDWIITNPPFTLAASFILRALREAREGVAMLLRTAFVEGADRYQKLFRDQPPTVLAPFAERVPMVKGRWDPAATTATSYAWFVWLKRGGELVAPRTPWWIPPGQRQRLTKAGDAARFAEAKAGSLL